MNHKPPAYGKLCSLFYDATKKFAPEKEVSFYASFIEPAGGRVLEAMSGSGRLQIPLLERGYLVDGVDNSPVMLDRCRQRCAELNLAPELYKQSLEDLCLPHTYSTVTIAVGSFQLIVERTAALKALKSIRGHMHDGGNLLIDVFTPDVRDVEPSVRIARIDQQTVIRLTTRYVYYEQERKADGFCLYELMVNGVVQQQENELISVTWYSDGEFRDLLYESGFDVVKIYEETFRSSGPSRIVHARAR